jgi:hypothetical protein
MSAPRLVGLLSALLACALVVAGPAAAKQARPRGLTMGVAQGSVVEGKALVVSVRGTCPVKRCAYWAHTGPGSARDKDFVAASRRKVLARGGKLALKLTIRTRADKTCEAKEQFVVRLSVALTGHRRLSTAQGAETIKDDDCGKGGAPGSPAGPAGPAAPKGDTGVPTVTNSSTGGSVSQTCQTPFWSGVARADGSFNAGCTVKLTCPAPVHNCQALSRGQIATEQAVGQHVALGGVVHAFAFDGPEVSHHDGPTCTAADSCTSGYDGVRIHGSESISYACDGVRETVAGNRSQVTCTLLLGFLP